MPHGARVTWPHIAHLQNQQNSQIPATQDLLQTPSPLRQYQLIPVPRRTWQCHHKHLHTTTDEIHCNETLSCPTINSRTQSNQTLNFVQWGQLPHCTTLGVKQTANMNPFLSVCQSWQQTGLIVICKGNVTKGVQNVMTQTWTRQRRTNDIHCCGKKRLICTMVVLQVYWKNVS